MPLSEEDQDAFVAKLVGSDTAPKGAIDYVSTRPPWQLLTSLPGFADAPQPRPDTVRVVMISDSHERHHLLDMPPGDVLVHSGDILLFNSSYSRETSLHKLCAFNDWLATLPYAEIVVVAGNHDYCLQEMGKFAAQEALSSATYLEHETCELPRSGLRVFGSPASVPVGAHTPSPSPSVTRWGPACNHS
jgi:hypothetical protein